MSVPLCHALVDESEVAIATDGHDEAGEGVEQREEFPAHEVGLDQRLLQRGLVSPQTHGADLVACGVVDGRGVVEALDASSIGLHDADLVALSVALLAQLQLAVEGGQVCAREEVEHRAPQHLLTPAAQQPGHGGVQVGGEAVVVQEPDALLGVLQQLLQQPGLVGGLIARQPTLH